MSRNKKLLNGTYPELVAALEKQRAAQFILDSEVVALKGNVTSFSRLQNRFGLKDPADALRSGIRVFYYIFDAPHVEGYELTGLGLLHRKSILKRAVSFKGPLRFCAHRAGDAERLSNEACRKGWEGLIAKRADSAYVQRRSTEWLKLKCEKRQEFVVGGFTDPQGSRKGFGALLVGFYHHGSLLYAGKVGSGYDRETLRSLKERLVGMEVDEPPFKMDRAPGRGVHWVRPRLVAEVVFTEWTGGHNLRHPRFLGLRRDKSPKDVVRERQA